MGALMPCRTPLRGMLLLLGSLLCVGGIAATSGLAAGDPAKVGAYCPFPKKGEKPACFAPVEKEYSAFFAAVDEGQIDDAQLATLEQKLEGAGTDEDGYLAISSLAYGYFRLAERAALSDRPDPALVARLNNLNELLSTVYQKPNAEPAFRVAVREAALDLHERAPAVATDCAPGSDAEECRTTGRLLRALKAFDDPSADRGVRGALGRLLERVTGPDETPVSAAAGSEPR